ncbi:MAG: methyltransferase domain-containing protein, partial [Gemmatimonadota bacterium]
PEVMDDPGLDPGLHAEALDALARINRVSLTERRLADEVVQVATRRAGPVRVLDVGCGDAAVVVEAARRAGRRGVTVEPHGCDTSPVALSRARARAARAGIPLRLSRVNVTEDPLPGGFDVATCSLFLHHLDEADAVRLLSAMAQAARIVLVQDLRRTRAGLVLAWLGVRLLSRSSVARVDGPRSVRAAFSLDEVAGLARRAGLTGATVRRAWPQRLVIRWEAA